MSQTYVIKVSASVQEHVHAKDKRVKKIVLTEIVTREEQKELVRQRLVERGFQPDAAEPEVLVRRKGDVVERVDLRDMTVEATVEKGQTLERERTVVVRGDRDLEDQEERRRREQRALEQQLAITEDERAKAQAGLQREIAQTLDETEEERTAELNEVVREVYAEGLKRKARKLGQVTEVREGRAGEDYELVIKITE
jgi:spore germination protein YaaH